MKRKRIYKPRRGIHFDRTMPQGPAAGFLGSEIQVVTVTGSVMPSLTQQNILEVGGFATVNETNLLNHNLLGLGTAGLDMPSALVTPRTGSIPSWTNAHLRRNQAFVITALSSSDHESQVLNCYRSGTEKLESSPLPASASMYYTKSQYTTVVVKKTASVLDLTRLPAGMDGMTPVYYVPGKGTDLNTTTGSLAYYPPAGTQQQGSNILIPVMLPINVPYSGSIVDMKVWIEIMQTSGSASDGGAYPLGNLTLAIRSPNVRGFHAHPIRNDPALKRIFTSNLGDFSYFGRYGNVGRSFFGPEFITPFWRDTFILWEGPGIFGDSAGPWDDDATGFGHTVNNHFVTSRYPSFQRDRSMRTVFCDGAPIPNPRHHYGASPSASYNGAPNSYFGFNSAYGFDVPWTSETEISGANTYAAAGSPPKGWLNGPGGTNLVDEWPTTGVNYGADYIKPLYPLLDPIYQRKRFGDIPIITNTGSAVIDAGAWTGYRPGLRGTEVSGTWYLVLGYPGGSRANQPNQYTPSFFRQVRLEFTLDTSGYKRPRIRSQAKGGARRSRTEVLIHSISGSDAVTLSNSFQTGSWDAHVSDTYLYLGDDTSAEVGRTLGIGWLTGSNQNSDFALLYRLSGALSEFSGSTPGWLMNNPFGVPRIPISSASLTPNSSEDVVGLHPQDFLVVRPILDGARRLTDAARDASPGRTMMEQYALAISGTST